ncbi:MAG: hypothetical protein PHY88_04920 [Candidatus Omnitrophica bacterium]|nr:hypothetical protein [Candidatus Omnitrophota bacterium]
MLNKVLAISLVCVSLLLCGFSGGHKAPGRGDNIPAPRLLYPIYDTVVLEGNAPLEFRWLNDYVWTNRFIFKLYKGYNMYASGLIFKQDVSPGESGIKIDSALFIDGQVYTWSLVMVGSDGQKSDKSFISFRIIRK